MNRLIEFDILRSLCAFWIVGIWHLTNYLDSSSIYKQAIMGHLGTNITIMVLSLFVFLSGLFINSKIRVTKEYFIDFYKKKLARFYFLYLISIITLYFTNVPSDIIFFPSTTSLLLSLIGFATITGNAPSTLWFLDLLLFLFLLTPIFLTLRTLKSKMIGIFAICSILYILVRILHFSDSRILIYTPVYLLGLVSNPNLVLNISQKYGLAAIIPLCLLSCLNSNSFLITICSAVSCIFIGGGIALCVKVLKVDFVNRVCKSIAYSSLCLYLFHRQLYALCYELGLHILIFPMVAFVAAYYIQSIYDKFIRKWRNAL